MPMDGAHLIRPECLALDRRGSPREQPELDRALARLARGDLTSHLEVETYTWEALPSAERRAGSGFDLVEALAREMEHVLEVLGRHGVLRASSPAAAGAGLER